MHFRNFAIAALAIAVTAVASPAQSGPKEIADIAAKVVPDGTRQMYLYYIPPRSNIAGGANGLLKVLTGNNLSGVIFAVGSEDSEMMVAVIYRAVQGIKPGSLAGCRFVFVGSAADREAVAIFVKPSGADFVFAEYREPVLANERPPYTIDLASGRRDFGFMKVNVPPGWFVRVEEGKGTKSVFITKEDISVVKQYTTGFSVNVIKDVPQRMSKKPSEYALALITQMTQKYENRGIEQSSSGSLKSSSSFLKSKRPDGQAIVQYSKASGNDGTGTVFVMIFESSEAEWDQAWKIGQALLQSLTIDEKF
jgi:hypothetical protein